MKNMPAIVQTLPLTWRQMKSIRPYLAQWKSYWYSTKLITGELLQILFGLNFLFYVQVINPLLEYVG